MSRYGAVAKVLVLEATDDSTALQYYAPERKVDGDYGDCTKQVEDQGAAGDLVVDGVAGLGDSRKQDEAEAERGGRIVGGRAVLHVKLIFVFLLCVLIFVFLFVERAVLCMTPIVCTYILYIQSVSKT